MRRKSFIIRTLISFTVLVLGTFAFPFLIKLVVSLTGPHARDTVGAVALVTASLLKPLFLLVVFCLFLVPIGKRLRGLDMNFGWLLFAFMCLAAGWEFLFSIGNFWGANFSAGILTLRYPHSLTFFFGFILFIAALPDKKVRRSPEMSEKVAWILAGICAVYYAILLAPFVVKAIGPTIAVPLAFLGLKVSALYEFSKSTTLFDAIQFLKFIPSVIRSNLYWIFGLACCVIVVMEHRAVRQYSAPEA
ncbi:hypothetical protein [uncultured Roseibium sp.]|uniref:hypothetical protein n=1 Tax=uncultured Roseibium sp. TaxID=1936171 RepID=UPI00321714C4